MMMMKVSFETPKQGKRFATNPAECCHCGVTVGITKSQQRLVTKQPDVNFVHCEDCGWLKETIIYLDARLAETPVTPYNQQKVKDWQRGKECCEHSFAERRNLKEEIA